MSSYEYTNSYTNLLDDYSNLDHYNNASMKHGPPLPATVPSNMFPTILKQDPIASYDVLTHGTQQQYPDVIKAYGNHCKQNYFVGKCPSNKEIRPFPVGSGTTPTPEPTLKSCATQNLPIVEGFKGDITKSLSDLKILFFCDLSGKCPYSKKFIGEMSKQLTSSLSEVFMMKDISESESVKQMFTNYGGYATPYFFSLKTNKSVTGYIDSAVKLFDLLKGVIKEGFEHDKLKKHWEDLGIVMFSSPYCGFCKQMKEALKKHDLLDKTEIIEDIDTSDYKHLKSNIHGFPTLLSRKTGKVFTGFTSDLEMVVDKMK